MRAVRFHGIAPTVVTIADREADIYELFATPRRWNSELLIRIFHDRRVQQADCDAVERLSEVLARSEVGGYLDLQLQRTPRRKARVARLSVRWVRVWLQLPVHQERKATKIAVDVVWAYEEQAPTEVERIPWFLVTTLPVWDFRRASEVLKSYTLRWLIERYHYCLKGACRVEQLQLSTAERLEKAIATFVIVAWRFLYLTYSGRDVIDPCSECGFSKEERETLYRYNNNGERSAAIGSAGIKTVCAMAGATGRLFGTQQRWASRRRRSGEECGG